MMRKQGKTAKRLRKLMWHVKPPRYADNAGVLLPTLHACISKPIGRQICIGEYESKEIEILQRRLAPDDVVMEVGAGIGFLSAFCARVVGDAGVHAYEANPAMIEVIRETHAVNRVAPSVVNAMLGRGDGSHAFFLEADFWASSTVGASPQAERIEVPQRDLNAELRRVAPTFLVVDIEGGEAEFFAQADLSGVRKLCLETHPGVLGDDGVSRIFQQLFAAGFVLDFSLIRKNVFFFYKPCT